MHRIKLLLGLLITAFSLVYIVFGWVAYYDGSAQMIEVLICFAFGSFHLVAGGLLLQNSIRDYKKEVDRINLVVRHLVKTNGGRVAVTDLAMFAEISEDDARAYLQRRARHDVATVMSVSGRGDVYFFGQQFWNN